MSEQSTSTQPNAHDEIAATIKTAAEELPGHVVTMDGDPEGVTRIDARANPNGGIVASHVQLDEKENGPDTITGFTEIQDAAPQTRVLGGYRISSSEDKGVEKVAVRRVLMARDAVTRAGATHRADVMAEKTERAARAGVYDHEFSPQSRDKAAKLITDMVIKQAARTREPVQPHKIASH